MGHAADAQPGARPAEEARGDEVIFLAEELDVCALTEVLAGSSVADMWSIGRNLREAAIANPSMAGWYGLLSQLCFMRLVVEGTEPYREARVEDDQRWPVPSDFDGAQNDELAKIVDQILHEGLRARVADVIFYNDRTKGRAGVTAVTAYAEIIKAEIRRLDEGDVPELERNGFDLIHLAIRAMQIARMTSKGKVLPEHLGASVLSLYERARHRGDVVAFHQIGEAAGGARVVGWDAVGRDSEAVAEATPAGTYDMPVYGLLISAGRAFERAGMNEDKVRVLEKSLDIQLRLRDAAPLAIAKAHHTGKAVRFARANGLRHRVPDLLDQLRRYEQESVDEFHPDYRSIDISDMRALVAEEFASLSLSQALRRLATFASCVTLDEVQRSAKRTHGSGFFSNMYGTIHNDIRGRQTACSDPANLGTSGDTTWFLEQAQRYIELHCRLVVGGKIEVARQAVMEAFPIEARHFHVIAVRSWFLPTGFEHIFSMGFARFWQGDYITAAYLLIPQVEGILRHVLDIKGIAIATLHDDGNQEDRGISALLTHFREPLLDLFGEDTLFLIEMLFCSKPGPNLRNEIAHGKLSTTDCYDARTVYACWFIYRLICRPLLHTWEEEITLNLEPVVGM